MAKILIGRKLNQLTDSVSAFVKNKLVVEAHDYIAVTATNVQGKPTTIEFKTGGAGGTLVATLTITYDANGRFSTVTKT